MPKITRYGGHTNAGLTERDAGFTDTTAATVAGAEERQAEQAVTAPFDPSGFTVAEVIALLEDCSPEEVTAIRRVERAGKARTGILSA